MCHTAFVIGGSGGARWGCPWASGRACRPSQLLTDLFSRPAAHPERAALLFVSSVCIGLALALCALVLRVPCAKDWRELQRARERLVPGGDEATEDSEDADREEDSSDSDFPGELPGLGRTPQPACSSIEAAELAERIERREQILQEIWMNSGLDVSLPRNVGAFC